MGEIDMIKYPFLEIGATIGVTAPSSGVDNELHNMFKQSCERMGREGYKVVCGETVWTQEKAKSSSAKKRANEFIEMMHDENIDLIIPPWGGELLIEILEEIDFEKINKKWVLGYSDTSLLLLAITLNTGIATAHGTNLVDLRGEYSDETTAMWRSVLSTETGASITQYSSSKYQKKWQHNNPTPCVFHLTEDTNWKTISRANEKIKGRLLGGCIDIIRHLIGTPFGNVQDFRKKHFQNDHLIWYFENCELTTTDLRRSLVQMKLSGWFENCSGILFGRSDGNQPIDDYTAEDVYKDLADELQIPIIYDIDCGHLPPQVTLINGAFAEIEVENGKGVIVQHFKQ
jgi:muramoyltetrapeptide carboxypeptidase LdcA involved in peptidoglycan recycling